MFRLIVWLLILALVVLPVGALVASFEREAALPASAVLTPRQAAQSHELVRRVRTVMQGTTGETQITATRAELDGLIATAARALPSLRGRTAIDTDGLTLTAAFQAPGLPQVGWVNMTVEIAPSKGEIHLRRLRVGAMELPPALAVPALRWLLDIATDPDLGTLLLASVDEVATSRDRVRLTVDSGGTGGESLFSRAVAGVRDLTGIGGGEAAQAHFTAMTEAAAAGRLPASGSAAPWLVFAVARVAEANHSSASAARNDMKAALLALAAHCGARSPIETISGALDGQDGSSPCEGASLGGRRDLRQHFTLSAALAASGGSAVSFGFGEVKELVDAGRKGGSGFSFDDIAADRAGIRFAEALNEAARDLTAAKARLTGEAAVMPSIEGLPSFMSEAEFKARYTAVDSPAYIAQIAEIDARIAALPFHAP